MKKIVSLLAATVLAASACSSGGGGSGSGPVELVMWHGQEQAAAKSIEGLVAEFNRTHPGIRVKASSAGVTADAMLPKVTAAMAGDAYPDIAYMYGSWAANIARSPKVADLTKVVADPKVGWADFWPNSTATATVKGKVIGFPAVVDNLVVLYNGELLDKAGVPRPKPEWTWDDFRSAAAKVTDPKTKTYGTSWPISGGEETTWGLWPLLWQNGGAILSPDGRKSAFNAPAGVQGLTRIQQMALQDKSVYLDSTPGEKGQKLFESGRLGLFLAGPWLLGDLKKSGLDYGVAVLPGTGGDHQTVSGPDSWVVLDHDSRRVKASAEFLTWLTAAPQQLRFMNDTGSLPTRKSISGLPGYRDYARRYPGIQTITENLANAKQIRPVSTKYARVSTFVAEGITSVLLGRAQPQQALDDAAGKSDAILKVPGQ